MRPRTVLLAVAAVAVLLVIWMQTTLLTTVGLLGMAAAGQGGGPCARQLDTWWARQLSGGDLSPAQLAIAATVVDTGKQLGIPAHGVVIALATAAQESTFKNLANDGRGADLAADQHGVARSLQLPHDGVGSDHGSLGVFQQQYPWWGSIEQLMTPATAARKFYGALLRVPRWQTLTVTEAADAVQRSAYPDAYANTEGLARQLLAQLGGAGTGTDDLCGSAADVSAAGWTLPIAAGQYQLSSGYGPRKNPTGSGYTFHAGLDFAAPARTPVRAATGGQVTFAGVMGGYGNLVIIKAGNVDTYYGHQVDGGIQVRVGDRARTGQRIGAVGSTGDSTGNHLHFEIRVDGASTDPVPFLRSRGVDPGTPP
jgi:murein DD-endopeptidase MepM/ murein hydrolase activator NlpD